MKLNQRGGSFFAIFTLVCAVVGICNSHAQKLIDIDTINYVENPPKVGFAATGVATNDYWNDYYVVSANVGALTPLKYADGTVSGAGLTVLNGPGFWFNGATDPMFHEYEYNQGGNITLTVTNLPAGKYDIYLYGHGPIDAAQSVFSVAAGSVSYGTNSTVQGPGWNTNVWQEGMQYVVFRGVQITNSTQPLAVIVYPGSTGYSIICGMQIAPNSGATGPPPNGATTLFFDDFNGPNLNSIWRAALPNAHIGVISDIVTYQGAPNYGFATLDTNTVLRLTNTLSPLHRVGWSSASNFTPADFHYEARFNTLNQSPSNSIDGFMEIWILDAVNTNRYDIVSLFGGANSTDRRFFAGSSIDNSYQSPSFNYSNNTYYRLVLEAPPGQNIRASLRGDDGTELIGATLNHGASAFPSGFKICLSQAIGIPYTPAPVDVAVDYVSLTSGGDAKRCIAPPSGLVGWWRAEGNANDSGGTNNGSLLSGLGFAPGKVGQAFSFDGSGSRVNIPDNAAFKLSSLTIEGWIFAHPLSGGYILFRGDDRPAFDPYAMSLDGNGSLEFGVESATANFKFSTPIASGAWKYVAGTFDGSTGDMKIYIDGVLAAQTNTPVRPLTDLDPNSHPAIGIGNTGGTLFNFPFNGLIDEISLYDRALSQAEIATIFNAGSAGKCVSPVTQPLPCFTYADFSSTNGLDIINNASLVGSVLRLTPATANQAGAAWYGSKEYCAGGFSTTFRFQITNPGSLPGLESGGDGISFSVQNSGTDVDSWETSPDTNSLGISLNTFLNPGLEVSDNFVGISTNNSHWLLQQDLNSTPINLSDGNVHAVTVECDGSVMSVIIDGLTVITNYPVPLGNALDAQGMAWVGFGARCGGAWENHDILSWTFCPIAPSTPPSIITQPASETVNPGANASFSVVAAGGAPLHYQWQFKGTNLLAGTNSVLSLTNVGTANVGAYRVIVSNTINSVTSSNAILALTVAQSIVQVVNTTASAGTVVLPINLVAVGSENALGFSVNFDSSLLTFSSVALGSGATGGSLISNTSQTGSGHLGLLISLPSGSSFAAGTQQVARITFSAAQLNGGTNNTSTVTAVSFGDQPILRQVVNAQAAVLPATYVNGNVTIPAPGYEGDVAPLPNGDGRVTVTDWVQVGRFVAGLDPVTNAGEFQRADCAPRSTLGDGSLTVADWVQAGRYAAGLDPLTIAGGPSQASSPHIAAAGTGTKSGPLGASAVSTVTVVGGNAQAGQPCQVSIQLNSQGDENALGFSLSFNASALNFTGATLGSGAAGATLNVNASGAASGQIGIALALPVGATFPASAQELVKLNFTVAPSASGSAAISFVNTPVIQEVSDANASTLSATYVSGSLNISSQIANTPVLRVSSANGTLNLSWPASAAGFGVESSTDLTNWSPVTGTLVTNGANVSVTAPAGGSQMFYRLRHP